MKNAERFEEVGHCDLPRGSRNVFVRGPWAYVTAAWKGLAIVNVLVPTRPKVVSYAKVPNIATDVFVTADRPLALVAAAENGLRVFNVANP